MHQPKQEGLKSSNKWFAMIYLANFSHNQILEALLISLALSDWALRVTLLSVAIPLPPFISKQK